MLSNMQSVTTSQVSLNCNFYKTIFLTRKTQANEATPNCRPKLIEMQSATISQVSLTRNPPRLFSSNFDIRSRSFPIKSSLSARNQKFGKEEHTIQVKDGVVIVDHGSRRQESNHMLNDFVAMFKTRTGYQIVEPAHMGNKNMKCHKCGKMGHYKSECTTEELAEPTIKDAFRLCVQQGVNRIIVSPFFLLPGKHWHQDIPALVAEAAGEHSGISYIITAPLGLHELMVDVMNDRIKHCFSHVAGEADECSMCAGTGRCHLY